jgi:hypothetical protein
VVHSATAVAIAARHHVRALARLLTRVTEPPPAR